VSHRVLSKNRPLALHDRMALLAEREQVLKRRHTTIPPRHDVMNVERCRAHGRPAALAGVPVTLERGGPSSQPGSLPPLGHAGFGPRGVGSARLRAAAVTKPDYHQSLSTTSARSGSILRIALADTGSSVVGAAFEEGGVVADTDKRPGIAGENHHGAAGGRSRRPHGVRSRDRAGLFSRERRRG
jgi:hypothetical protein